MTRTASRAARFTVIAATLLLLTGCSTNQPDDIPEPPVSETTTGETSSGAPAHHSAATTPLDDAPGPATSSQTAAGPARFLGSTINDPDFTDYLARNQCFPGLGNWNCWDTAVEFSLNTGSRVVAVMFKAPGVTTSTGYQGALPAGVTFTDSVGHLTTKLGPPLAGTAKPGGLLKWQDGNVALFVRFFPRAPLRIHTVQLDLE